MLELNDRVRIKNEVESWGGHTGRVSSILLDKTENNIGVDIEWDHGDPTPMYFNEDELEPIK